MCENSTNFRGISDRICFALAYHKISWSPLQRLDNEHYYKLRLPKRTFEDFQGDKSESKLRDLEHKELTGEISLFESFTRSFVSTIFSILLQLFFNGTYISFEIPKFMNHF